MKKILIFILIIVALLLFLSSKSLRNEDGTLFSRAHLGNTTLSLFIADDSSERTLGLSRFDSLPEDGAMLFIFEREGNYGFWMKGMNFPIDIIWLDKDFQIVDVRENISPETYPEIFRSEAKALYVLETNPGILEKEGLLIGDSLEIF